MNRIAAPDGPLIADRIRLIRGQKVLLDSDLAALYEAPTKRFNEQVKRNVERFPADFMFQLSDEEYGNLRSQIATSSSEHGGRRYSPYAFTEHGALMAATVLNSPRAVEMSIFVVRAFVQIREMLSLHKDLAARLDAIEGKYDANFKVVFDAIRQLMAQPVPKNRPIGFTAQLGK